MKQSLMPLILALIACAICLGYAMMAVESPKDQRPVDTEKSTSRPMCFSVKAACPGGFDLILFY